MSEPSKTKERSVNLLAVSVVAANVVLFKAVPTKAPPRALPGSVRRKLAVTVPVVTMFWLKNLAETSF
jgi:hypothetical protein